MMKNYDESVEINHNSNWPYIPDHPYRISMNHMRHPCSSVDTAFSHGNQQILLYQEIQI